MKIPQLIVSSFIAAAAIGCGVAKAADVTPQAPRPTTAPQTTNSDSTTLYVFKTRKKIDPPRSCVKGVIVTPDASGITTYCEPVQNGTTDLSQVALLTNGNTCDFLTDSDKIGTVRDKHGKLSDISCELYVPHAAAKEYARSTEEAGPRSAPLIVVVKEPPAVCGTHPQQIFPGIVIPWFTCRSGSSNPYGYLYGNYGAGGGYVDGGRQLNSAPIVNGGAQVNSAPTANSGLPPAPNRTNISGGASLGAPSHH